MLEDIVTAISQYEEYYPSDCSYRSNDPLRLLTHTRKDLKLALKLLADKTVFPTAQLRLVEQPNVVIRLGNRCCSVLCLCKCCFQGNVMHSSLYILNGIDLSFICNPSDIVNLNGVHIQLQRRGCV